LLRVFRYIILFKIQFAALHITASLLGTFAIPSSLRGPFHSYP